MIRWNVQNYIMLLLEALQVLRSSFIAHGDLGIIEMKVNCPVAE